MTMGNVRGFLHNPLDEYHAFDHTITTLAQRWGLADKAPAGLLQRLGLKKKKHVEASMLVQSLVFSASGTSVNRRLVRTRTGYLGLVPFHSRSGDKIGLFRGGALPLVIREVSNGYWHVVGDAYVHGVMMGEVYDDGCCHEFSFV